MKRREHSFQSILEVYIDIHVLCRSTQTLVYPSPPADVVLVLRGVGRLNPDLLLHPSRMRPSFRSLSYVHPLPPSSKQASSKSEGPFMLVLAPTRELALQSAEVIAEAGKHCGVKSVCVYGGVPKREQRIALGYGGGRGVGKGGGCVEVVVATPGRLKDLVGEGACDLSQVGEGIFWGGEGVRGSMLRTKCGVDGYGRRRMVESARRECVCFVFLVRNVASRLGSGLVICPVEVSCRARSFPVLSVYDIACLLVNCLPVSRSLECTVVRVCALPH